MESPVIQGFSGFESKNLMCQNRENIGSWEQVKAGIFECEKSI